MSFPVRLPVIAAGLALLLVPAPAPAQDLLPERRAVYAADTDLPGGDLRQLFDTTLEACERACLSDARCTAFTFNTRNGSCFPKTDPGAAVDYRGALSARIVATAPEMSARAQGRRGELGFLFPGDFVAAREQAEKMGREHAAAGLPAADLARMAREAEAAGDLGAAVGLGGAAVSAGDAADLWADHARRWLLAGALPGRDRRAAAEQALAAAVNGYLRAESPGTRHALLVTLAEALEATGRGARAVNALRLAQAITPRDDTARLLDRVAGLYGFRIVEHEVQSDLPSPRLCARFSEDLVEGGLDYLPYVQLPEPGLTVETGDWRQLCVGGLRHGTRYALTFREGLPAADGQVLPRSVTIEAYVRDRSPGVRFPGRGYVVPALADPAIPVETVNTGVLDLVLYRVSDRNLIRSVQNSYFGAPMEAWRAENFETEIAEVIWRGRAEVPQDVNRDLTTRLPLADALSGQGPGIYVLRARIPGADEYERPSAWQWFVVTDLGVTTVSGNDGLLVAIRSLSDLAAREGVEVVLLSRSNRELGTSRSDAQGIVRFPSALTRGTGGAEPALLVLRDGDADLAFLSLSEPEFDLSDRGVAGRPPAPPVDVFLTTDRGAYRTGETVHVTALARDPGLRAVTGLPLTFRLRRPDGVEYAAMVVPDAGAGGHVAALPIAPTAPRGSWRVEVLADPGAPPLSARSFLVEDFLPERIDFALDLPEGPLMAGSALSIDVTARHLFGAPASGLPVEGEVILRAAETVEGWEGWRFGRAGERFTAQMEPFAPPEPTAADGSARITVALPAIPDPGRPLEAEVRVRLSEGSGRPVERSVTRPVASTAPLIGLRPAFDGVVPENAEARIAVVGIADGAPVPMQVKWRLDRIETRYQWYQLFGNWNWEPVTRRSRIAEGTQSLEAGPAELSLPVTWGEYELTVERDEANHFAASSLRFAAGWFAPADAAASPDRLEMSLDRTSYAAGDTAMLRVVARAAGTALVMVLSDRVIDFRAVDLTEGETLIPVAVTEDWGSGAYVAVSALRGADAAARRLPARAMGIAHAAVEPGARRLSVRLDLPDEAEPRGTMETVLNVTGARPGDTVWATLAAVDVGILNLTAFTAPDPEGHYFGQRRLGVGIRDLYGRLIDGLSGAEGLVRSGGDGGQPRLLAPPPTEELMARFAGPLRVGPDGTLRVPIDLPAFNGTVRVMAVVWSETAVGEARAEVPVRDPVVVTASLPRFLAPGDEARLLLEITHARGPTGRLGLDVVPGAGLNLGEVPSGIDLEAGETRRISVPMTALGPGDVTVEVALTTPGGQILRRTLALRVQRGDPEIQRTSRIELGPNQSLVLDAALLAGLSPDSARATVSAGPLARLDAPGLLAALDRYPYGCTEQIASRALPLLYLGPVAQALDLPFADDLRGRIAEAVRLVLLNQNSEGGFGLWRADFAGDLWLDAYATDFLSRARTQGHDVPQAALRAALDNLRSRVNYYGDFDRGGADLAYALMVLAREGAAAVGDLRYHADVKGDAFDTPLAAAQLGAALATYGDPSRADAMFARAARLVARAPDDRAQVWRADYGTALRDAAGVLALALEAGSSAVDREALAARLAARPGDRPLSTQEQAWLLLAAHALVDRPEIAGLTIDGAPWDGPPVRRFAPGEPPRTIRNTGSAPVTLTVTAFGISEAREPAGGQGYAIDRRWFTMQGEAVDPARVRSGTRLVTVLEITPFDRGEARLIVADPLPAGFEIDNPNLIRGGQIAGLDWLDTVGEVAHAEFRQDRFLAALDRFGPDPFRLAYVVRAVTPGSYHLPAASVEDMYRPAFRAWTDSGRVTVTE